MIGPNYGSGCRLLVAGRYAFMTIRRCFTTLTETKRAAEVSSSE